MRIIYDCTGADQGAEAVLAGIQSYLEDHSLEGILLGLKEELEPLLPKYPEVAKRFRSEYVTEVILNTDEPAFAIRRKKDSAIVKGMRLLKEGAADGFISAGSTGGLLAGGLFLLGRLPNVSRAVLPVYLPSSTGGFLLLDSGANMDCTPEQLLSFGKLGTVYAREVLGIDDPKVALLNVGAEPGKGNEQVKKAFELFSNAPFHFIGNMEARDAFFKDVDVLVTDGFAGNVMLKNTEGVAMFVTGVFHRALEKFGADDETFLKKSGGALREVKKLLDYSEYGGAPLLGLKAPVIKAHGSSDSTAFKNATRQLKNFLDQEVISKFQQEG